MNDAEAVLTDTEAKYFENLLGSAKNVQKALKQISDHMGIKGDMEPQYINDYIRANSTDNRRIQELASRIQNLVIRSNTLSSEILNNVSDYVKTAEVNIQFGKDQRKAERSDRWRDWCARYVRWVLGLVLAILLYSLAVQLEDDVDFIKIPGRDLILKFAD